MPSPLALCQITMSPLCYIMIYPINQTIILNKTTILKISVELFNIINKIYNLRGLFCHYHINDLLRVPLLEYCGNSSFYKGCVFPAMLEVATIAANI